MTVINSVRDPAHWRNILADLANRIAGAQSRVDANEADRNRMALVAFEGDIKAQRALDQLNADRAMLDLELANLTRARIEAEKQLIEAEARAEADVRWRERSSQRRDLKERARIAREMEECLRLLVEDLQRVQSLSERIRTRHRSLGGQRILIDPLATEAVASRLGEYLHGLGVPAGTLGSEGSALRIAMTSYAETEEAAQALYDPDRVGDRAQSA